MDLQKKLQLHLVKKGDRHPDLTQGSTDQNRSVPVWSFLMGLWSFWNSGISLALKLIIICIILYYEDSWSGLILLSSFWTSGGALSPLSEGGFGWVSSFWFGVSSEGSSSGGSRVESVKLIESSKWTCFSVFCSVCVWISFFAPFNSSVTETDSLIWFNSSSGDTKSNSSSTLIRHCIINCLLRLVQVQPAKA